MALVAAGGKRGVRRCTEESPPADVLSGPLGSLSYSGEGAILKEEQSDDKSYDYISHLIPLPPPNFDSFREPCVK